MTKALTVKEWNHFLTSKADQLASWAQGTGLDAGTLTRIAVRELQGDSKLRQCTKESLYLSLTAAAQLGLEPTGINGEGHLMPFRDNRNKVVKCQFVPGYQGLAKLAYQTDKVALIWAETVYEHDKFRATLGTDPKILHEPQIIGERGEVIAAYACARMRDGNVKFEILPRAEIEKIRNVSKMKADGGPWDEWFSEMAKKSAVRRLCKLLPRTTRMEKALALATAAETGQPDLTPTIIDVEPTPEGAQEPEEPEKKGAQAARDAVSEAQAAQ